MNIGIQTYLVVVAVVVVVEDAHRSVEHQPLHMQSDSPNASACLGLRTNFGAKFCMKATARLSGVKGKTEWSQGRDTSREVARYVTHQ
jgi:hypothetical protein